MLKSFARSFLLLFIAGFSYAVMRGAGFDDSQSLLYGMWAMGTYIIFLIEKKTKS